MTIDNVKVTNYEKELVDKLRLEKYFGIPLSIVLLSQPMCIGKAHHRAIQLTKGMDEFKIVSGNINTLPKDYYPNHSWVENNGWVYDTTNGKKYLKEIYYDILSPDVIKVRDEKICMLDSDYIAFYHDGSSNSFSRDEMNLMLQTIEVLEKENPTINHEVLLEEIEQFRQSNGLYPIFKDDNVKQLSKKMFPDYYKALKL